jgi:hypothetical protein
MFDDLLILLDDELLMSFLGYGLGPGTTPPAPQPGIGSRKGGQRRIRPGAYTIRPPAGKSEDEIVFQLMREASLVPLIPVEMRGEGRERSLGALAISRQEKHYESQLNPSSSPMPAAAKKIFERQNIIRGLDAAERRRSENEELAKKVANHVKMAKVRAAKRKK